MTPMDKLLLDCKMLGYDNVSPTKSQYDYLLSEINIWCSKDQIEYQKKRLTQLKLEGKYPIMDPHEGYGDIDIDAEFVCSCNALHINADNGISMGLYILDESGNYVPKNSIIHKKTKSTFLERIASIFGWRKQ